MTTDEIRDFLNNQAIPDATIIQAMNEAVLYLARKHIDAHKVNPDVESALKHLTAYFILPNITVVSGETGITKSIGFTNDASTLLSDYDMQRRQKFHLNHANDIIADMHSVNLPFGVDI